VDHQKIEDETIVDFYFDPVSPYTWLASTQLDRISKTGTRIICRPVLLAGLLDAHGTTGPAEVPAKRAYFYRDVMREAARLGLEFSGPPAHPFNPLSALRAAHAIEDSELRLDYVRALMSAIWSEGIDATDPKAFGHVLTSCGANAKAVLSELDSARIKQNVRDETKGAIDAGIFGVPTFRLNDQLFWGSDRVDTLIWALEGGVIDEATFADALARPVGAKRSR